MNEERKKVKSLKPVWGIPGLVAAIVSITVIATVGAVYSGDQAASILSFCGAIIVALVALIREQKTTHDAVNSKMDRMLIVVEKAKFAEGLKQGREETRKE